MKTTNVNQPGEKSHGIVRGHIGATRAGSSGHTVTDGSTEVDGVIEERFRGAAVLDLDEGVAEITITGTGQLITNGEATTLSAGEVVVLDAATNTVIYTTTPQDPRPVGVVQRSTLSGEAGPVVFTGFVEMVLTTSSVSAGDYLETSITAGQAQTNPTRHAGSFGVVLDPGGDDPPAMLAGSSDTTSPSADGVVVVTVDDATSAYTIDAASGDVFDLTLTANCTLSIINSPVPSGFEGEIVIILRQGGSGSYTVTWWGSLEWQNPVTGLDGGDPPVLYTAVGAQNVVVVRTLDGGVSWGGEDASRGGGIPASTVESETTFGITPAVGTDAEYARQDHTHGTPANPVTEAAVTAVIGGLHAHVVSETHLSNGSGTTYTLDQFFEPGSVIAWNVTTLARLGVTETAPDQATVSAAGSSGDSIVFDYAASIA